MAARGWLWLVLSLLGADALLLRPLRTQPARRRAVRSHGPSLEASPLSDDAIAAKLKKLGKGRRRPPPPSTAPVAADSPSVAPPSAPPPPSSPPPPLPTPVAPTGPPAIELLRAKVAYISRATAATPLDEAAASAIAEFLNGALGDAMLPWVLGYTELGKMAASKNVWSRGAWVPTTVWLEKVTPAGLTFAVGVRERGKPEPTEMQAELAFDDGPLATVDELRDALLQLSSGGGGGTTAGGAEASAIVLRLPGASDDWSLPDDLWLNTTPYQHSVRNMFYDDVAAAMQAAVADPACSRLMTLVVTPPELNMEMDSYRVGSLLELTRECALGFAGLGMRTRVCVQGSMGEGAFTGVPRVLSGVRKVLQMMDWQAEAGEEFEGLLGRSMAATLEPGGEAAEEEELAEGTLRFGAVGAEEVAPDDEVIIVLAPQSMVGASIYEKLKPMADACVAQGTALLLINPLLQDVLSSSSVMGVRGRSERMAFAESFEEIYHFRNIYSGTTFMFPILGAMRWTRESGGKRVLFQRREGGGHERYEPVGCWLGREPTREEMSALVPKAVQPLDGGGADEAAPAPPPAGKVSAAPATVEDERMPWD